MAHGLNTVLKRGGNGDGKTGIGSRRIFAPAFKLQVLDSYRNDADCKGNQRATARKYGIHRRQIQKWLQVEGNLRNSVMKSKCPEARGELGELGELALSAAARQRDAAADAGERGVQHSADKRVPDIPQPVYPVPVLHEWRRADSVHSHSSRGSGSLSPPAPLDFTTHARQSHTDTAAPIDLSLKPPRRFSTPEPQLSPRPAPTVQPDPSPVPSHPDIWDLSTKRPLEDSSTHSNPRPVKLFKPYLDNVIEEVHSPPAPSVSVTPPAPVVITNLDSGDHFNFYNNNNNYQADYQVDYALYNEYYYNGGLHFVRDPYPACVKQRQSYSVDFKLSAIECYYSDAVCRGNQRAVASKFKIHRRQVQKWLKQEDQLRQRVQPLHIVR